MYDYEFYFIDDKNEIGLDFNKTIKVYVDIEYRWYGSYHDNSEGEMCIESIDISTVLIESKSNNLLESFKNDKNYWDELSEEKKELVKNWVWHKLESKEIIEILKEEYLDQSCAAAERYYERLSEG